MIGFTKNRNSGFAPIVVIIAVVILAGLVGGGYFAATEETCELTGPPDAFTCKSYLAKFIERVLPKSAPTGKQENPHEKDNGGQKSDRTDTSIWKTYRNEQYGFEVKYPPNYLIKESVPYTFKNSGKAAFMLQILTGDTGSDAALAVHVNNPYLGLPKASSTDEKVNINGIVMAKSIQNVKLGFNLKTIYYSFARAFGSVIPDMTDNDYVIMAVVPLLDTQTHEAELSQIVSTFKFIK